MLCVQKGRTEFVHGCRSSPADGMGKHIRASSFLTNAHTCTHLTHTRTHIHTCMHACMCGSLLQSWNADELMHRMQSLVDAFHKGLLASVEPEQAASCSLPDNLEQLKTRWGSQRPAEVTLFLGGQVDALFKCYEHNKHALGREMGFGWIGCCFGLFTSLFVVPA